MKSLKTYVLAITCALGSLCSAAAAATLTPGQTQTGTIGAAAQTNTYTFSANAGDVFDFTLTATSGSLSPEIQIYNSSLKQIATASPGFCDGSTVELNTVTIPVTGTYSVWVSDCSDTNTGNYALYSQRITGPLDAVALPLGETEAGTIGLAAQSNTYTFTANAGDVIDFTMTVTSGVLSPKVRLYSETTGTLVGLGQSRLLRRFRYRTEYGFNSVDRHLCRAGR